MRKQDLQVLARHLKKCRHNPLLFVRTMFAWNQGELLGESGPDQWQTDILTYIGQQLQQNALAMLKQEEEQNAQNTEQSIRNDEIPKEIEQNRVLILNDGMNAIIKEQANNTLGYANGNDTDIEYNHSVEDICSFNKWGEKQSYSTDVEEHNNSTSTGCISTRLGIVDENRDSTSLVSTNNGKNDISTDLGRLELARGFLPPSPSLMTTEQGIVESKRESLSLDNNKILGKAEGFSTLQSKKTLEIPPKVGGGVTKPNEIINDTPSQKIINFQDSTTFSNIIRTAIASGHGIGKSALVSWLILWSLYTMTDTKGVVTANTESQLRTKTWAELNKWHRLCLGNELFKFTATAIFSTDKKHEKTWRIDAIPWSVQNTEAFAGLHNKGKRLILIFDEASAIDDKIYEVAEGALTDSNTEIIWTCFGNPTRNSGRFKDCFNKFRHRWYTRHIDSRDCKMGNKAQFQAWAEDYGEDSDFFRVRVRGEFPRRGEAQFISVEDVEESMKRTPHPKEYEGAPAIIGVDPSFDGGDEFIIVLRQGNKSKFLGCYPKNDNDAKFAQIIADFEDTYKAQAVFIDKGYGTGLYSFGKVMGREWKLVAFGSTDCKDDFLNKRAEMWYNLKQWIKNGGCLPNDSKLKDDLVGIQAFVNDKGKLQMEKKKDMKARGLHSPDRADAFALTFAYPVTSSKIQQFRNSKLHGKIRKAGSM